MYVPCYFPTRQAAPDLPVIVEVGRSGPSDIVQVLMSKNTFFLHPDSIELSHAFTLLSGSDKRQYFDCTACVLLWHLYKAIAIMWPVTMVSPPNMQAKNHPKLNGHLDTLYFDLYFWVYPTIQAKLFNAAGLPDACHWHTTYSMLMVILRQIYL